MLVNETEPRIESTNEEYKQIHQAVVAVDYSCIESTNEEYKYEKHQARRERD